MKDLFVVVGMPRGGTTYLYHNLQNHPQIFMPFRKEVNYFNVNFGRGEEWYRRLYEEAKDGQVCADISPPCFMEELSEDRILSFNPNAKAVLVIRDPLEWALSFYAQFSSFNFDMIPFSDFVNGYEYKIGENSLSLNFTDNYIPKRIETFKKHFGKNLLIYNQKVLKKDALSMFKAFEKFLGLDPYFTEETIDDRRINASDRKNIVWLQRLLANEKLISMIEKYFPRKLVLSARKKFDSGSVNEKARNIDQIYSEEDLALAKKLFSDQQVYIDDMFAKHDFLLGDGTALEINQQNKKRA